MSILRNILAYLSAAEKTTPVPSADKVLQQKAEIGSQIDALLCAQGLALHSSLQGSCLYFASKMRESLLPMHPDLQLWSVFGHNAPVIHYHLRTPESVILDPTWQMWLSGDVPEELPPVFVGIREDLIRLVRPHEQLLPKRCSILGRGPALPAEDFVDLYYGFGPHAHTAKDVTSTPLVNAHKDPQCTVPECER